MIIHYYRCDKGILLKCYVRKICPLIHKDRKNKRGNNSYKILETERQMDERNQLYRPK
jgi:hypothetical protein